METLAVLVALAGHSVSYDATYDGLGTLVLLDESGEDPVYRQVRATLSVDEKNSEIRFFDKIMSASFCPLTSNFICMSSSAFVFAVPKSEKETVSWKYADHEFHLQARTTLNVWGVDRTVEVILATPIHNELGLEPVVYYFSRKFGVVALNNLESKIDGYSIMLSRHRCGLGAQTAACTERKH